MNSYAYVAEEGAGADGATDFMSKLTVVPGVGKGVGVGGDLKHTADAAVEANASTLDAVGGNVAPSEFTAFSGYAAGFSSRYKPETRREGSMQFAALLDRVASVDPEMRVRFTSPHPKDFPDEVLEVIKNRPNVCKCLHMPAQSGSTTTLERMARGYTREAYLDLIKNVHEKIPGCAITTDIITGFCAETEEEHEDTVSLMKLVKYEQAFMFAYSEREGTAAARKMSDDVDDDVKQRRLAEIIDAFRSSASERNEREIGRVHLCLVEGVSKKNDRELTGKTDTSKWVVFADDDVGIYDGGDDDAAASSEAKKSPPKPGEYVAVLVTGCSTGTLFGTCLGRTSLVAFDKMHGGAFKEASEETAKASAAAGAR